MTRPASTNAVLLRLAGMVPGSRRSAWKLPRTDWRRCMVQAMLLFVLSVGWNTPEYLRFNTALIGNDSLPIALVASWLQWFGSGMVFACTAQWVEGRLRSLHLVVLFLLETIFFGTYAQSSQVDFIDLIAGFTPVAGSSPYLFWNTLVIDGGFFWYCLIVQRSLRTRELLARAELERARTAAQLGAVQVLALEGRVEPALLQRVLVALSDAYARDRAWADALLDALVDFLRQAMPALRSGRSTLGTELNLLRCYAELMARLDGGRRVCSVSAETVPCDAPFAPLLLIPLVEALAAAQPALSAPPSVGLTVEAGQLTLTLDAQVGKDWLSEALKQRLDRALRTSSPAGARYVVGESPSLTLWLSLSPTSEEQHYEATHPEP